MSRSLGCRSVLGGWFPFTFPHRMDRPPPPPPETPRAPSRGARSHPEAQPVTPAPKRARIAKFERHPIADSNVAEITRCLEALPWEDAAFLNCHRAKYIDQGSRHFDATRPPSSATLGLVAKSGEPHGAVLRFAEARSARRCARPSPTPSRARRSTSTASRSTATRAGRRTATNFRHSYIAGFGRYDAAGGRLKFWAADPRVAPADADAHALRRREACVCQVRLASDRHATEVDGAVRGARARGAARRPPSLPVVLARGWSC